MAKRRMQPFSTEFGRHICEHRDCKRKATFWIRTERLSRSQNVREVTSGPYCEEHAKERVARGK